MKNYKLSKEDIDVWKDALNNPKKYFFTKSINTNNFFKNNTNNLQNLTSYKIEINDLSRVDFKLAKKIKNGKIIINDILDLHNYCLNEAEQKLNEFIVSSFKERYKFILVITGKGKYTSVYESYYSLNRGSIRNNFINWVNSNPINNYILAVSVANKKHGGEGAFYIILKTNRYNKNIYNINLDKS